MAIASELPFGLNKGELFQLYALPHNASDELLEIFFPVQSSQKCGARSQPGRN